MRLKLKPATTDQAAAIAALRTAVAENLTARFGQGPWSSACTEKGVLFAMRNSAVYVAMRRNKLIVTLTLATKKPWAINRKYFSPSKRPLYLVAMAVHPDWQRQAVGRLCIEEAKRLATEWPGDALFLDAYDAAAGAGEFYRKCGFREAGRVIYRKVPLIYFEKVLPCPKGTI